MNKYLIFTNCGRLLVTVDTRVKVIKFIEANKLEVTVAVHEKGKWQPMEQYTDKAARI